MPLSRPKMIPPKMIPLSKDQCMVVNFPRSHPQPSSHTWWTHPEASSSRSLTDLTTGGRLEKKVLAGPQGGGSGGCSLTSGLESKAKSTWLEFLAKIQKSQKSSKTPFFDQHLFPKNSWRCAQNFFSVQPGKARLANVFSTQRWRRWKKKLLAGGTPPGCPLALESI